MRSRILATCLIFALASSVTTSSWGQELPVAGDERPPGMQIRKEGFFEIRIDLSSEQSPRSEQIATLKELLHDFNQISLKPIQSVIVQASEEEIARLAREGIEYEVLRQGIVIEGRRTADPSTLYTASMASEFGSNGSDVNIPDNNSTWSASSTISINGAPNGATVTTVDVHIEIIHTYVGDLEVVLDNGARSVWLWQGEGGSSDNINETYTNGTVFAGDTVNRNWILRARDLALDDVGYIDYWWIRVYYNAQDPPIPEILPISNLPSQIELGQSFDLEVRAENDGGNATYGSISISFPDFDNSGDAQYVTRIGGNSSVSDYDEYPEGMTIWHRNGYQFSADYLLAEQGEENWGNNEEKSVRLRIEPQEPGIFDIYIRATMGIGDDYYNDPSSSSYEDQQGWEVERRTVTVLEPSYSVSGQARSTRQSFDVIPGATVTIDGKSDVTDSEGRYTIDNVTAGTHIISIAHNGYFWENDDYFLAVNSNITDADFEGYAKAAAQVDVDIPPTYTEGDPFDITVTLTNTNFAISGVPAYLDVSFPGFTTGAPPVEVVGYSGFDGQPPLYPAGYFPIYQVNQATGEWSQTTASYLLVSGERTSTIQHNVPYSYTLRVTPPSNTLEDITIYVKGSIGDSRDPSSGTIGQQGLWEQVYTVTPVGDLEVTVQNINAASVPLPGPNATVWIRDNNDQLIETAPTDNNGVARFSGIVAANGYSIEVRHDPHDPTTIFGEEYWGKMTGITVNANPDNAVTFRRNMPFDAEFDVFNNSTGQQVNGQTVASGTELRLELTIWNPDHLEPRPWEVKGHVVLDRDQTGGYDFDEINFNELTVNPGFSEKAIFFFTPTEPGGYYPALATITDLGGPDVYTNGGDWWDDPVFTVMLPPTGNLSVTVQNINGSSTPLPGPNAMVDLKDSNDQLVATEPTDVNGIALFQDVVSGTGYAVEVRHLPDPITEFGLEYWGRMEDIEILGNSTNPVTFQRNMPYVDGVAVFRGSTEVTWNNVTAGIPLSVRVTVRNNSGDPVETRTRLVLDLEQDSPFDVDQQSTYEWVPGNGGTLTYEFDYTPTSAGPYYVMLGTEARLAPSDERVTDGLYWYNDPLFTVEPSVASLYGQVISSTSILLGPGYTIYAFRKPDAGSGNEIILLPFVGHDPLPTEENLVTDGDLAKILYQKYSLIHESVINFGALRDDELVPMKNYFDLDKWWTADPEIENLFVFLFKNKRKVDRVTIGNMSFWGANEILKAKLTGGASVFGLVGSGLEFFHNQGQLQNLSQNDYQGLILAQAVYNGQLTVFEQLQTQLNIPNLEILFRLKDAGEFIKDYTEAALHLSDASAAAKLGRIDDFLTSYNQFLNAANSILIEIAYDSAVDILADLTGMAQLEEEAKVFAWLNDAHADGIYVVSDDLIGLADRIEALEGQSPTPENIEALSNLYDEFLLKYTYVYRSLLLEHAAVQLRHLAYVKENWAAPTAWFVGAKQSTIDDLATNHYPIVRSDFDDAVADYRTYLTATSIRMAGFEGALEALKEQHSSSLLRVGVDVDEGRVLLNASTDVTIKCANDYAAPVTLSSINIDGNGQDLNVNVVSAPSIISAGNSAPIQLSIGVPDYWFTLDDGDQLAEIFLDVNWIVGRDSFSKKFPVTLTVGAPGQYVDLYPSQNIYRPNEIATVNFKLDGLTNYPQYNLASILLQPDGGGADLGFTVPLIDGTAAVNHSVPGGGPFGAWGIRTFLWDTQVVIPDHYANKVFYIVPATGGPVGVIDWNDLSIVYPEDDFEAAEDVKGVLDVPDTRFYKVEDYTVAELRTIAQQSDVVLMGGHIANPLVGDIMVTNLVQEGDAIIEIVKDAFGDEDALVIAGWSLRDTQIATMGFLDEYESLQERTLTVSSSNPDAGVHVAVSPDDNNGDSDGNTVFTRVYSSNTTVTLTADPMAGGNVFEKWQSNGVDFSTNLAVNVTMDQDYMLTAVYIPSATHTISGNVVDNVGSGFEGVTVTLSGDASGTQQTDPNGDYSFPDLTGGSYTLTPSMEGFSFDPPSRAVTIAGDDVTGQDFAAVTDVTPPAAPTGLAATPGDGAITLTWTANTEPDLAQYNVYLVTGQTPSLLASVPGGTETYTVTGLSNSQSYSFFLRAEDAAGNESADSEQVSAMPVGASIDIPIAPGTNLPAALNADGADNYIVQFAGLFVSRIQLNGGGGPRTDVMLELCMDQTPTFAMAQGTSDEDDSVLRTGIRSGDQQPWVNVQGNGWPDVTQELASQCAQVRLNSKHGQDHDSELILWLSTVAEITSLSYSVLTWPSGLGSITATQFSYPDITSPAAPTGLGATSGDGEITLTWTANTEPDLAQYNVYDVTGGSNPTLVAAGTETYTVTGLSDGETRSYVLRAEDAAGNESPDSDVVSATTLGGALFSEDWESGTIDLGIWEVWGSPSPVATWPGFNGSTFSLDVHGDGWCDSGVHTVNTYPIAGTVLSFQGRVPQTYTHFQNVSVGIATDDLRGGSCPEGGYGNLAYIHIRGDQNQFVVEYAIPGEIYTEPFDDQWHAYEMRLLENGQVEFYRDGNLVYTTTGTIDYNIYSHQRLFVAGRSQWQTPVLIDDIKLEHASPGQPTTVDMAVRGDWNLIALPLETSDASPQTLFPNAIDGTLFGFDDTYYVASLLEPGKGYWLRFPQPETVTITGEGMNTMSMTLDAGWNLIAGISCDIALASVNDPNAIIIDGTLFGFDGSYYPSSVLQQGYGYWLRASDTGTISFSCTGNAASVVARVASDVASLRTQAVEEHLRSNGTYGHLQISDASGSNQALYFSSGTEHIDARSFSLPPAPPPGVFDARFASGTHLGDQSGGVIQVQVNRHPLIIHSVRVLAGDAHHYELRELIGSQHGKVHVLAEGMRIEITDPRVNALEIVRVTDLPEEYRLEPNYPNPFNIVTTISYVVPQASQVRLVVYDLLGRQVVTLVDGLQEAGRYAVSFDASGLASGFYVYRMEAGSFRDTKKLLLVK